MNAKATPIPDNEAEIESFIETELEMCIKTGKLVLGDPRLILEIQDALLKGSQGMFLWTALQIDTLCDMETDEAICEALKDLPKDLSETFARILRRSKKSGKSYQKTILELVMVARHPLTAE